MEKSYQEKILDVYHGFEAVRDCFAISRIQTHIGSLSQTAGFNASSRDKSEKLYAELNAILDKYKDVIQPPKGYGWLSAGCKAWIQGAMALPVEVEVIGINFMDKTAEVRTSYQAVKVPFERLYETEEECPCR